MSYRKGNLLSRMTKLVNGYAIEDPGWIKSMQMAPPAVFPRVNSKVKVISLPEDVYVSKFYQKHPESKYEDPVKLSSFHPVPARIFASRVLELKEQGVGEEEAMAAADMEYRAERKAKKQAYTRLKQISRVLGEKPHSNPYPSAVKEIQAEERPYVRERFFDPQILDMVRKIKEEKLVEMQERFGGQERPGGQQRIGWQERSGGQQRLRQDRPGGQPSYGGQDRSGGQQRLRQDWSGGQLSSGGQDKFGGRLSSGGQDMFGGQLSYGGQDRSERQPNSGGLAGFISRQNR